MSVKINLGMWNSIFAVPSQIVDEGLKFSDGVKLKVLLFILRNSGRELTEEEIERILEEEDRYYIEQGVINGVW